MGSGIDIYAKRFELPSNIQITPRGEMPLGGIPDKRYHPRGFMGVDFAGVTVSPKSSLPIDVSDSPPKNTAIMSHEAIHLIEGRAHKISSPVTLPTSNQPTPMPAPTNIPTGSITKQQPTPASPSTGTNDSDASPSSRAAKVRALLKTKKAIENEVTQIGAISTPAPSSNIMPSSPDSPGKGKRAVYQVEHRGRVMCLMFSETHLIMSYGSQAPRTSDAIASSTHISYNDIIGADRGGSNLFRLRIWRAKPAGMEETAIELATINPHNPERFLRDLAARARG